MKLTDCNKCAKMSKSQVGFNSLKNFLSKTILTKDVFFFKKENNVGISLRQISEGQLLKYTNMMKGWQNRWFVLDPHTGMLEYFMVILLNDTFLLLTKCCA